MQIIKKHFSIPGMLPLASLLIILGCARTPAPEYRKTLAATDRPLAAITLQAPSSPQQRHYLGIETTGVFALSDIRTEVLIIEVFDFYCPYCQREAPMVNRLYRRITGDPELRERIKLIGIGVSNTQFEVDQFRKAFDIPFPLFPDRSRDIAHLLGVRQTPTFIGIVRKPGQAAQRFLTTPGSMGNADTFLSEVLEKAKIGKTSD
jgi:thiol-disulfide isomerase/thioredoxin